MALPFGLENETMTYTDGRSVTYAEHLEALRQLMDSNHWECRTIDQVAERLQDFAIDCSRDLCSMSLCGQVPFFIDFLPKLRKWTQDVVTDAVGWCPNLIVGIVCSIMKFPNYTPSFRLLADGMLQQMWMMESDDDDDDEPVLPDIGHVIGALYKLAFPSAASTLFLEKYGALVQLQLLSCIKEFDALVRGRFPISKKYTNHTTGAEVYDLQQPNYPYEDDDEEEEEEVILHPFLSQLQIIEEKVKFCHPMTRSFCLWKLSESLSRVWRATSNKREFSSPLIDEIVLRSLTGDFPANEIKKDITECKMSQLYFLGEARSASATVSM